ncbi:MAG TPA: acyl-CoA reductase, partial [Candidatus Binataceae bacterium]|nr:acyl-CoA reductase [Candidatus Binataceae bacterium]
MSKSIAPALGDVTLSTAERESIDSIVSRLRRAASSFLSPDRSAAALARACGLWRDPNYQRRRSAIAQISANSGLSEALLSESLKALLLPFSAPALESFAAKVKSASRLIGFVMPGNVVGAGMHELVQALVSGAAVLVKCASSEPVFFIEFARTIAELYPELAARISVLAFGRDNRELTRAMQKNCDAMVVLGDDDTVDILGRSGNVIGFGSRVSGALISREALAPGAIDAVSDGLARDITLFEQRGCLSPHHVFIASATEGETRHFAGRIARSLDQLAQKLLPPRTI